jgi:hypothetical protein
LVGTEDVRNITAELNVLLADVFALYVKTKNFHWHRNRDGCAYAGRPKCKSENRKLNLPRAIGTDDALGSQISQFVDRGPRELARNASAVSDAPRQTPETTCNSLRGASDTAV